MLLWFLRHCWQLNYRFPYSSYFQKQESFIGNHKVLKFIHHHTTTTVVEDLYFTHIDLYFNVYNYVSENHISHF